MPKVDLTINGRSYQVSCQDGQEDYLLELTDYVNGKMSELIKSVGHLSESHLLVMCNLLIADELSELRDDMKALKNAVPEGISATNGADEAFGAGIEALANRIESIAERLEQT
ncbi:MAG: cell division protein ZapA [Rhodospirillales bacterium]|nr:cell division protein ZapA [Rhodospirillales bacterium]